MSSCVIFSPPPARFLGIGPAPKCFSRTTSKQLFGSVTLRSLGIHCGRLCPGWNGREWRSGTEISEESRSCSCCFAKRLGSFRQIRGSTEIDGDTDRRGHGLFPALRESRNTQLAGVHGIDGLASERRWHYLLCERNFPADPRESSRRQFVRRRPQSLATSGRILWPVLPISS